MTVEAYLLDTANAKQLAERDDPIRSSCMASSRV
jgi:hypothetical protein